MGSTTTSLLQRRAHGCGGGGRWWRAVRGRQLTSTSVSMSRTSGFGRTGPRRAA